MTKWKALTIYGYHDGPTLFTATPVDHAGEPGGMIYLFRWEWEGDLDNRSYKADGHGRIVIKETDVDWNYAESWR